MPKYSVVLPVRNGGEYLKMCVMSILSQTLTDFNLEILDNHSADGTLEWLNSLNDKRIIIFPSDKPLSIEENWNRIATIPKNEFMTFIGHDDLLDDNFLEVMECLINKHPKAGLYQAHYRYIDDVGNKIRSGKPMDEKQDVYEYLSFFLSGMSELSIGQVMRSEYFNKLGGFSDYPNLLYADLELWISLIGKKYRACSYTECSSKRIHESSATSSSSPIKYYYAFLKLLNFFVELKKSDNRFSEIFQKYSMDFLKPYSKSISHHLLRIRKKDREGILVKDFISQYKNLIDALIADNNFYPENEFSIKMAKQIDNSYILHKLFLIFKKLYSKPILHG